MGLSLLLFALFFVTIAQTALPDDAWQFTTDGGEYPTWSPDGSQIAFESDKSGGGDLWVIPGTGGAATRILWEFSLGEPDWSPDGTQIVSVGCAGRAGCFIGVIAATGGPWFGIHGGGYPCWSHDGSMIAFLYGSGQDIWAIPIGATTATQITDDPAFDICPAWSADGSQLAFTSDRSMTWGIWIIDVSAIAGRANHLGRDQGIVQIG